jgi:hypothetical protein
VGAIVLAAIIGGLAWFLVARRRRRGWLAGASRVHEDGTVILASIRGGMAGLSDPATAASFWATLEQQFSTLRRDAAAVGGGAPGDRAAQALQGVDSAAQGLHSSVEADRQVRVGPPAPSAEQLDYTTAVIRERSSTLEAALGRLSSELGGAHQVAASPG